MNSTSQDKVQVTTFYAGCREGSFKGNPLTCMSQMSQAGFGCKVMKGMGRGVEKLDSNFLIATRAQAATQSPLNMSIVINIRTPSAFFY